MEKTIWISAMVLLIGVAFLVGYLFDGFGSEESVIELQEQIDLLEKENAELKADMDKVKDDEDKKVNECFVHLKNYYNKRQGVISVETGTISIGFMDNGKDDVIKVIKEYGLSIDTDRNIYATIKVPVGDELKWICTFLNDDRISNKIRWIEPNALVSSSR